MSTSTDMGLDRLIVSGGEQIGTLFYCFGQFGKKLVYFKCGGD